MSGGGELSVGLVLEPWLGVGRAWSTFAGVCDGLRQALELCHSGSMRSFSKGLRFGT